MLVKNYGWQVVRLLSGLSAKTDITNQVAKALAGTVAEEDVYAGNIICWNADWIQQMHRERQYSRPDSQISSNLLLTGWRPCWGCWGCQIRRQASNGRCCPVIISTCYWEWQYGRGAELLPIGWSQNQLPQKYSMQRQAMYLPPTRIERNHPISQWIDYSRRWTQPFFPLMASRRLPACVEISWNSSVSSERRENDELIRPDSSFVGRARMGFDRRVSRHMGHWLRHTHAEVAELIWHWKQYVDLFAHSSPFWWLLIVIQPRYVKEKPVFL